VTKQRLLLGRKGVKAPTKICKKASAKNTVALQIGIHLRLALQNLLAVWCQLPLRSWQPLQPEAQQRQQLRQLVPGLWALSPALQDPIHMCALWEWVLDRA
jgi:hypothetical protein